MSEILTVIAQLSVMTFIITSMLAMGLSLTIKQIMDPLRDTKVVLLALLANFVLVPAPRSPTIVKSSSGIRTSRSNPRLSR